MNRNLISTLSRLSTPRNNKSNAFGFFQSKRNSLIEIHPKRLSFESRFFAKTQSPVDSSAVEVVKSPSRLNSPLRVAKEVKDQTDLEIKDIVEQEKTDPDWEVAKKFVQDRKWAVNFDSKSRMVEMKTNVGTNAIIVNWKLVAQEEDPFGEEQDEQNVDDEEFENQDEREDENEDEQEDENEPEQGEEEPIYDVTIKIDIPETKSSWTVEGIMSADPAFVMRTMSVHGTAKDEAPIQGDMLTFSNEFTQKVYEYLFSLGVDDALSHFVRCYSEHLKRQQTVEFLQRFRESLPKQLTKEQK